MSNSPQPIVTEGAFLTLHYRLSSADGREIVTTFNDSPATLQLGSSQLAPFLESRLFGLPEGAHEVFELTPEQVRQATKSSAHQQLMSLATDVYEPGKGLMQVGKALSAATARCPSSPWFAGLASCRAARSRPRPTTTTSRAPTPS
jgi:FKBP-type peptidyl-prolyl cis-trans isomerase SlpA